MQSTINATPELEPIAAQGSVIEIGHLLKHLKKVKDGRKRRGVRYPLEVVLLLFILAKLCGENKPYGIADWVQQRSAYLIEALDLKLKRHCLPHHSTYRRILTDEIDADELEEIVGSYFGQVPQAGPQVAIVIDGKTLRGTICAEDPFGLHLLAAYMPEEGIVLMQMVVEKDKENEIVVAPKLLKCLDLRNKVVLGDAMHTQRALSTQIVAAGGNFIWQVKDNQPQTRQAIEQLFTPAQRVPGRGQPALDFQTAQQVTKQAGRLEKRCLTSSSLLNDYLDWPSVGQVFKLERQFRNLATGKVINEVRYGLTSLSAQQANPQQLLTFVRQAWRIENSLHYRRDVTFQEDQTRITKKSMGRVMAIINNLVIGLLNSQGFTNHAQARRLFNASPDRALKLIRGL